MNRPKGSKPFFVKKIQKRVMRLYTTVVCNKMKQ